MIYRFKVIIPQSHEVHKGFFNSIPLSTPFLCGIFFVAGIFYKVLSCAKYLA